MKNIDLETKNWRDNWFVKNVVVAIPIIGSFFKKKSWQYAFYDAGKCAAVLVGGTTAMMNSMPTSPDSDVTKTKIISSMTLGMIAGKVIYNGTYEGFRMLYQFSLNKKSETSPSVPSEAHELEALNAHDIRLDVQSPRQINQ